jgi:hypothetical protein
MPAIPPHFQNDEDQDVQNNISFVSRLLWLKDEVSYFEEGIN